MKPPSPEIPWVLLSAVDRAAEATRALVAELRQVGAPPGEAGTEARDIVDGLRESLRVTLLTIRTQLRALDETSTATEATTAIAVIA